MLINDARPQQRSGDGSLSGAIPLLPETVRESKEWEEEMGWIEEFGVPSLAGKGVVAEFAYGKYPRRESLGR